MGFIFGSSEDQYRAELEMYLRKWQKFRRTATDGKFHFWDQDNLLSKTIIGMDITIENMKKKNFRFQDLLDKYKYVPSK